MLIASSIQIYYSNSAEELLLLLVRRKRMYVFSTQFSHTECVGETETELKKLFLGKLKGMARMVLFVEKLGDFIIKTRKGFAS